VVDALFEIRSGLVAWLRDLGLDKVPVVWAVERQMSQADVNGWLMMLAYCAVCEVIAAETVGEILMVAPYPNQLKAYIRRRWNVGTGSKTQIRLGQRRALLERGCEPQAKLVSSHKAEAWFLAQMARDVLAGRWFYEQAAAKVRVFPWPIIRGERR
jgi:hypothetical protein